MSELKAVTKDNVNPQGMPRVYILCHRHDFALWFQLICDDVFRHAKCAVFYENDRESDFDSELESNIKDMQLIIAVVTRKFLTDSNDRAFFQDFAWALKNRLPILPICVEPSLGSMFDDAVEQLGVRECAIQYLDRTLDTGTEVPYDDKLGKRLESTLVGDELAKQIRSAFAAYIFLSYRKVDRMHARQLMKQIHSMEEYRDLAIWYDEFLIPGEEWRDGIKDAMAKSELMVLAVTPSLLEKPNYIVDHEYPDAVNMNKEILPVELVKTDIELLQRMYEDMPAPIDGYNMDSLKIALKSVQVLEKNESPEHHYLIGLAYINGIDVEKNVDLGLPMIMYAANNGVHVAAECLSEWYMSGTFLPVDLNQAIYWRRKSVEGYVQKYGENFVLTARSKVDFAYFLYLAGHDEEALKVNQEAYAVLERYDDTFYDDKLMCLSNMAVYLARLARYEESLRSSREVYEIYKLHFGEENLRTIIALTNVSSALYRLGEYAEALETAERVYELLKRVYGESHEETIKHLNRLSNRYHSVGQYEKALEYSQKACEQAKEAFGDENPFTLSCLNNLPLRYAELGRFEEALKYSEEILPLQKKVLGESHIDTLLGMSNYALFLSNLGRHKEALKVCEETYDLRVRALGVFHPDTIITIRNMADLLLRKGDCSKALEKYREAIACYREISRENHPEALDCLYNMTICLDQMKKSEEALRILEDFLPILIEKLGSNHPKTVNAMIHKHHLLRKCRQYRKAYDVACEILDIRCTTLGPYHEESLLALFDIGATLYLLGERYQSFDVFRRTYLLQCQYLGAEHPDTQTTASTLQELFG